MIRRRLIISNILILVLTILILMMSAFSAFRLLFYRENAMIYDTEITAVYHQIGSLFKNRQNILLDVCIDEELQTVLKDTSFPEAQEMKRLIQSMKRYTRMDQLILEIVNEKSFYKLSEFGYVQDETWRYPGEMDYGFHWVFRPDGKDCLRVWRYIYDSDKIDHLIGVAALDLKMEGDMDELYTLGVNSGMKARLYLLDEDNRRLLPYGSHVDFVLSEEKIERLSDISYSIPDRQITVVKVFSQNHWKLVAVIESNSLLNSYVDIKNNLFISGAILLLLAGVLTYLSTKHTTQPIAHLAENMPKTQVSANCYQKLQAPENSAKEIKKLYDGYNKLITIVNESLIQVEQAAKKRAEDKFLLLQAQINPHFLYNSLNVVNWLARNGRNNEVQNIVIAMGDLFRSNLNGGNIMIRIEDEIKHLHDYILIMKYRYPDLFTVKYDIEKGVSKLFIIKQILQPLAENAIIHGFVENGEKGSIHISIRKMDQGLCVRFANNGTQIDFNALRNALMRRDGSQHRYTGIRNVRERLSTYYGVEYSLDYQYENGWTVVKICVPICHAQYEGKQDEESIDCG